MRRTLTMQRPTAPHWGSRLMLYGAVALIAAAGYMLYVQVDTSRVWLTAIFNSNRAQGTSAFRQLILMFETTPALRLLISQMLFLLALTVFAFVVIGLRQRTGACAVMLLMCGLCFWAGCMLDLYSMDPSDLLRLLYALPLAVIAVGCVLQLAHSFRLSHMPSPFQRPRLRRPGRFAAPAVKRTAPEKKRLYKDAPGATRMLPDAQAPMTRPADDRQPVRQPQRREQPVPEKEATHVGEPAGPSQEPQRYQWKTIKKQ